MSKRIKSSFRPISRVRFQYQRFPEPTRPHFRRSDRCMYTEPRKKITEQLRWDFAGQLIHQFVITVWIKLMVISSPVSTRIASRTDRSLAAGLLRSLPPFIQSDGMRNFRIDDRSSASRHAGAVGDALFRSPSSSQPRHG